MEFTKEIDAILIIGIVCNCIFFVYCILLWITYWRRRSNFSQRMLLNCHFSVILLFKNVLFLLQMINNDWICAFKRSFNISSSTGLNLYIFEMTFLIFFNTLYHGTIEKYYKVFYILIPIFIWIVIIVFGILFFNFAEFIAFNETTKLCWNQSNNTVDIILSICDSIMTLIIWIIIFIVIQYIRKHESSIENPKRIIFKLSVIGFIAIFFLVFSFFIYIVQESKRYLEFFERFVFLIFFGVQTIDSVTINEIKCMFSVNIIEERKTIDELNKELLEDN